MTQDSRLRADLADTKPSWGSNLEEDNTTSIASPTSDVNEVARTLAAYGGGTVSVDLAFDLILNEVVEQARNASRATGAAIALFRDGELVCRATSGENAPDLGVRVEAGSSLAGTCVSTGEIQQCRDTESDPRVNAEACRRLGVRSMLIAPLVDTEKVFGILQVFSSRADAFGKLEVSALQVLAGRVAESNREARAGSITADAAPEKEEREEWRTEETPQSSPAKSHSFTTAYDEEPRRRGGEIWSSILVLLVISVAVLLGLVIGWHRAAKGTGGAHSAAWVPPVMTMTPESDEDRNSLTASDVPTPAASKPAESPVIAPGGLLVTQNGKVIYRSPAAQATTVLTKRITEPIHRVEPEYPPAARAQHIQGSVVLDVQVLGNGSIGNIAVVSGNPVLADAALLAVKQWRYQPNVVGGRPVESQTRITIRFTLPSA
jgi:TonB family protein